MKNTSHKICALVLTWLAVSSASGTGLVNGDFEAPPFSGFGTNYTVGSPTGFGWTIATGNIDLLTSAYWQPSSGNQSVDLNGSTAGSMYQDFNFSSTGTWTVQFDLSANPDQLTRGDGNGTGLKNMRVDFGPVGSPASLGTYSIDPAPRSIGNMQYVTFTTPQIVVTDASVLYRLQFTSLAGGNAGNVLDNVQLQLVPEPSMVTLVSSAMLGWCVYRHNRKVRKSLAIK
jgi:hypothetical protein